MGTLLYVMVLAGMPCKCNVPTETLILCVFAHFPVGFSVIQSTSFYQYKVLHGCSGCFQIVLLVVLIVFKS